MISLDASAIVYLMKIEQNDVDGVRGRKVQAYVESHQRKGVSITVPVVAVAEVLAKDGVDQAKLSAILEPLELVEFDMRAAEVAGRIARTANWKAAIPPVPGGRQIVKLDTLIAATALSALAHEILTNDHRYDALVVGRPIAVTLIDALP